MRKFSWLMVPALLAGTVVACSDDEPSASEQVCDARTDLRSAVNTVVDDVRAGNFGQARDDLQGVSSAFDELKSATDDLAGEQREALSPDVEQLQADVSALTDVSNLDQLGANLSTIQNDVQSIFDEISSSLDCP